MSSYVNCLLIIANSGRMLAESAHRAGYQVVVIDCYGDIDTEAVAEAVWVVKQLTIANLQTAIAQFVKYYQIEQVLIGSGFEAQAETLAWLESRFLLRANGSATIKAINDPKGFCQTLDQLQINYPETQFHPPEIAAELWLLKPYASEGGINIRQYQGQPPSQSYYWQRNLLGPVYSVLFVANGVAAQSLAYHSLWTTAQRDGQDFVFAGLMQCPDDHLTQHHKTICRWLNKLTAHYALVGLNGIDFIIADEQCYLLEINARPPASMVLYLHQNLVELHINACKGSLPTEYRFEKTAVTAYQIIYASVRLTIPDDFIWPQWSSDQPKATTIIDTDQPICSIIVSANNAKSALKLLQYRTQTLYQLLNNKGAFSTCTIQPALINYPSL